MVVAVAQYPGFSNRAISRQRSGENAGQTPATPEPILVDRFESKGIQRYLVDKILSVIEGFAIAVPP
jgi:hypothetical protein